MRMSTGRKFRSLDLSTDSFQSSLKPEPAGVSAKRRTVFDL